jgi:hypothetical protein
MSAEQARAAGVSLDIVDLSSLAPGLAEVRSDADIPPTLFAMSDDASHAIVADRIGPEPATLTLVRPDRSQLRMAFPGVLAAAFSPDASTFGVTDGLGRLWLVHAADGSRQVLAEGPFIGRLLVEPSGSVLALQVASVEAPFTSHIVRVGSDGTVAALSSEELVYGFTRLEDGGLAVISHRPSGTIVSRLGASGESELLADLGPDAVNVAVARGGAVVAFERTGAGVILRRIDRGGQDITLPGASGPRFTLDGESLLVEAAEGATLFSVDGRVIASVGRGAGVAGCGGRCWS